MKDPRIIRAYDAIAPDETVRERMLQSIREASPARGRRASMPRRMFIIAACLALLAAFSVAGVAAYQKWSLPKPESYPFSVNGNTNVQSEAEYTNEILTPTTQAQPLTDADFASKAVEILTLVGLQDVDTTKLKVARQENLYWDRQEVEVRFLEDTLNTSVSFDAERGILLRLSGIDWEEEGAYTCQTKQEAQALVEQYYAKLPVTQGYELLNITEYDEQYWSFDYCRALPDGIYNEYEMVRLGLNPKTGRLCGVNIFFVPLLDDHEPGDEPLTQAQAEAVAHACPEVNLDAYTLKEAKYTVVLPNWSFTGQSEGNLRASKVSRLGWSLVYENTDSEICDQIRLDIDYYTGEILGGDMT